MAEKNKNLFDKFAALMDQNIKGVQYGVYAVAGIGFLVAMRSVRPFKKFYKPSDIPRHFIEKRMKFSGKVVNVRGDTLFVDHYPVISNPLRGKSTGLPVKIASVNITPNGGIWLNSILNENDVNFIPLTNQGSAAESIVYNRNKKEDVGQHLVSIGFATVAPYKLNLDLDPIYRKYYKGLLTSERRAENSGAGLWHENKVSFFQKIRNNVYNIPYIRPFA